MRPREVARSLPCPSGALLKQAIFDYLKSRGWGHARPGALYAWCEPDGQPLRLFCWSAALLIELGREAASTEEQRPEVLGGSLALAGDSR